MKKHQIILVIFFGTVLLACLQILGCFHHHSHSTISDINNSQILVANREVSSDTEFEQYFGELALQIQKGSCEDGYLSVSQTVENNTSANILNSLAPESFPVLNFRTSTSSFNNDFEIVSKNIYSINLINRNKNSMLLSSPAKLTFNINNDYPTTRYYAVKKNEDSFSLISPNSYTSSNLSFNTYSMSEWFLVKEKKYSQIEKAPTITCSTAVYTNGKDSCFKNDLEVKISVPYNQAGKCALNIYGRDNFPLSYNSVSNSASNSYQINLTSLAQPEISSELATYSLTIKLKEYSVKDYPGFIVLKAEYTDPSSGINYSTQKRISLLQGEKEVDSNPRPFVVSSNPKNSDKTEIISVNDKITIEFSQTMDTESVEQALILNPYVSGDITTKWSSDYKVLTISGSFDYFETYKLSINNTACSKTGLNLENNFVLIFGTPKPSSENTDTKTNSETNTETKTNTETNSGTNTKTNTNTNTGTNSGTNTNTNTNTNTDTNSGTNTNTNTNTNTD
ncbi:MAG: Ig-like domain-containing protein, partial [Candidatus Riflebacteria bacterium]|nr:Ig-like domain-containing protein [Candidatus Riflebacteria bacterium]